MDNREMYRIARQIQYKCKQRIKEVQNYVVFYDNHELRVGYLADEQKIKRAGFAVVGHFDYLPHITNIELQSIVLEVFGYEL